MHDGSLVKQVAVLLQEIVPSAEGPAGDKKLLANEKQSIVDTSNNATRLKAVLTPQMQMLFCADLSENVPVTCRRYAH